ncbi:DUF948 domain-containing protein [Aerococcaceae bacterium 50-4]
MTGGQIAGLIAAIAFAALVIYIILFLRELTKTMKEVTGVVNEANETVKVVTKDVDALSIEVQGLLNKSNVLLDDVNGKVAQVDPLFKAIGDIGVTVSDVNDSTRNLVLNITNTAQTKVDDIKDKTVGEAEKASTDVASTDQPVKAGQPTVTGIQKVGQSAKALYQKRQVRKAQENSQSKPY